MTHHFAAEWRYGHLVVIERDADGALAGLYLVDPPPIRRRPNPALWGAMATAAAITTTAVYLALGMALGWIG